MRPSETLSERLVAARSERGWRQSDVAQRVTELGHPLDRGTVAKIERGERRVTVDDAAAFAEALGVSLSYLLGAETHEAEEEGVELRFEVTVKLLASKDTKAKSRIEQLAETDPELQRLLDADPTLKERLEDWHRKSSQMQNEIISKGGAKQGRTRLTGKDKVPSTRRVKKS